MKQNHLTRLLVIAVLLVSLLVIGSAAGTLTEGQQIRGDCNGDGAINMKDVLALRKIIAGLAVEGYVEAAADVTADGSVNMKDVLQLRKFVAGLISSL